MVEFIIACYLLYALARAIFEPIYLAMRGRHIPRPRQPLSVQPQEVSRGDNVVDFRSSRSSDARASPKKRKKRQPIEMIPEEQESQAFVTVEDDDELDSLDDIYGGRS